MNGFEDLLLIRLHTKQKKCYITQIKPIVPFKNLDSYSFRHLDQDNKIVCGIFRGTNCTQEWHDTDKKH